TFTKPSSTFNSITMDYNSQHPLSFYRTTGQFVSLGNHDDDHDTSLETFVVSLATNAAVFAVFFSLFLLMRKTFERVYSPRTFSGLVPAEKQPDQLPNGVFWFLHGLYNISCVLPVPCVAY